MKKTLLSALAATAMLSFNVGTADAMRPNESSCRHYRSVISNVQSQLLLLGEMHVDFHRQYGGEVDHGDGWTPQTDRERELHDLMDETRDHFMEAWEQAHNAMNSLDCGRD